MNPRRRRHNKRARKDREWSSRYQCWIRFREGVRHERFDEAQRFVEQVMTDLLNRVVIPEVSEMMQGGGYAPCYGVEVVFDRKGDL